MIKINGRNVGFKFNINRAIESIGFIKGVVAVSSLSMAMIWCGYQAWCFVKQIDEEITFEEMIDWMEADENQDQVAEIAKELEASKLFKVVADMLENLKKKLSADELKAA